MTCFSWSPSSLPLPLPSQNLLMLHEPSSPSEQTSLLLCAQPTEQKRQMCEKYDYGQKTHTIPDF